MRLPRQLESLARMLTYMLCHRPDEFGLILSPEGFVPVKHLLQALSGEPGFAFVRRHHLEEVAALLRPPGIAIIGEQMRGLSPGPARLRRPPEEKPPVLLYLAIPPKVHNRVWEQGLKAPPGQELVLATRPEVALKLGRRRSPQPILVTVQAQAAAKSGIIFQGYGEELFLTQQVPRPFLQLPTPSPEIEKAKPLPPERPPTPPGTVVLELPELFQEMMPGRRHAREHAWKDKAKVQRKKRQRRER